MDKETKEKLDEVIDLKINEIEDLEVSDENFKDAASGCKTLIEARELPEDHKMSFWEKVGGFVVGVLTVAIPGAIAYATWNKSIEMDNEGVIQPNTARNVFKEIRPRK